MRITKTMCQTQVDMLNTTLHGDAETHTHTDGKWRSLTDPERYVKTTTHTAVTDCAAIATKAVGMYDMLRKLPHDSARVVLRADRNQYGAETRCTQATN